MSTHSRALVAPKACIRCSTQKKRCDKALPECGLCTSLGQICSYKRPRPSTSGSTPPSSQRPEAFMGSRALTISHLKDDIIQKLVPLTPEDAFTVYCRAIVPWFPIVSTSKLGNKLPLTWDEASLDVTLICLSIKLLTAIPPSSPEDDNDPSEFKSLYFETKCYMASAEALGINSVLAVQSRILVSLFEVAHGFYPAAYISSGAIVRAVDALDVYMEANILHRHSLDNKPMEEDRILIWCGILVLDRYISTESGPHPSLTRSRHHVLNELLKPTVCPTHQPGQDRSTAVSRLARLFEASSLLDKIHDILHRALVEDPFNIEELITVIQAVNNLQTLLIEEIGDGINLYSGGLSLCNTALLLAFEDGSNVPLIAGMTDNCKYMATKSLAAVLSTIVSTIEPFALGILSMDLNLLSPFVLFSVYKAAAIVTRGLLTESNSDEGMRNLKILRKFLKLAGRRWLGCERYLKLLDEDTTPRLLKALVQE